MNLDQGEKNIRDTTKRAIRLPGRFDELLIFEAPDDETATALMMHVGSLENAHTSTVRAFVASGTESIMEKLPTT